MIEGHCHCGAAHWRYDAVPDHVTACNCTFCRRAGGLWIYGHEGETVQVDAPAGALREYVHGDRMIAFLSCNTCGNLVAWRGLGLEPDGRRRMAVNLRLTEPGPVDDFPIKHLDGLHTWESLSKVGTTVKDMWF